MALDQAVPDAHAVLLAGHVLAGSAALLLGPVVMYADRRPGRFARARSAYQVAVGILTTSAVGLAALEWAQLWWLAPIGVATEAAALGGWAAGRHRSARWIPWRMRLMGGSYIALVTALLVVSTGSPAAWALPTLVGTPLIEWAASRASAPQFHPTPLGRLATSPLEGNVRVH